MDTRGRLGRELIGKVSQRETILVESHPEEDDDGKDENQRNDTLRSLFFRQFGLIADGLALVGLTLATLNMTEGAAEDVVDGNRQNQRGTGHSKGEMIGVIHRSAEVLLGPLHDAHGSRRSKECTDVNGHVEK